MKMQVLFPFFFSFFFCQSDLLKTLPAAEAVGCHVPFSATVGLSEPEMKLRAS